MVEMSYRKRLVKAALYNKSGTYRFDGDDSRRIYVTKSNQHVLGLPFSRRDCLKLVNENEDKGLGFVAANTWFNVDYLEKYKAHVDEKRAAKRKAQ